MKKRVCRNLFIIFILVLLILIPFVFFLGEAAFSTASTTTTPNAPTTTPTNPSTTSTASTEKKGFFSFLFRSDSTDKSAKDSIGSLISNTFSDISSFLFSYISPAEDYVLGKLALILGFRGKYNLSNLLVGFLIVLWLIIFYLFHESWLEAEAKNKKLDVFSIFYLRIKNFDFGVHLNTWLPYPPTFLKGGTWLRKIFGVSGATTSPFLKWKWSMKLTTVGKMILIFAVFVFGYSFLTGFPITNRILQIISFEILGLNWFLRSFVLAFEIGLFPEILKRYLAYMKRRDEYEEKLKEEVGKKINKIMAEA